MQVSPVTVLLMLWAAWFLGWLLASVWTAKTLAKGSLGDRLLYGVFMSAGSLLLIFRPWALGPQLLHPLWLTPAWLGWTGVALACLGFGVTWWARVHLGRLWSSAVTLKAGHAVIRTGPYAFTRHPIYSGLLLALVSTAVVRGTAAAALGLALTIIGIVLKLRLEERLLTAHLGDAYRDYKEQVSALLPGIL